MAEPLPVDSIDPNEESATPPIEEPAPYDVEAYNGEEALTKTLSRVMSSPHGETQLEALTRVLSTRTLKDGEIEIDPSNFDLRSLLKTLVRRMDSEGIELNTTGVGFRNLTSTGVDAGATYAPSVGELLRAIVRLPKALMKMRKPPLRNIIDNIDGLIVPGEMLLVLGRPGSGCSTLLKTIAGEIDQFKGVHGEITYDGVSQADMLKNFKNQILYNPELDVHFPHLTVEQTLRFAIACRTPRTRLDNISRKEYQDRYLEVLGTVFGLRHTFKTKVGNDFVRGVSGGERKRVSIAEALAARGTVYCWDNATRGLDASTALEYNHAIRAATNYLQNIAVVAIYQAGENIYKLYDKVTVLYNGRQIYFGPAEEAKDFFVRQGWECPPRQTTPEFLTAVTDPKGRKPRPGFESKVPTTAIEFEQYWKSSPEHAKLIQQLEDYDNKNTSGGTLSRVRNVIDNQMKEKRQPKRSRYILRYGSQLKLAVIRGLQRIKGDKVYTIIHVAAAIIQALIIGSLFYNIPDTTSGAFSRGGAIFFALLYNALSALAEISHAYEHRPILLKQKGYSFYHPSVEALQASLSDLVTVKLCTLIVFSLILYFMVGLYTSAGQFFFFLLVLILACFAVTSLFQMIAALTKSASTANSIAGVGVLILSVYAGYMIPTPTMHPWFRWLNWLDPLAYGFESLMANEFHAREMPCNLLVPSGPGYENITIANQVCAFAGSEPGNAFVNGNNYIYDAFRYSWSHAWRNIGIIIGLWLAFLVVNCLASEFLRPVSGGGDVLLFKRGHLPSKNLEEGSTENVSQQEIKRELSHNEKSREVFSWQHVDYTIPIDGGTRKLLDDVQGYVKPGTLTALMGESGAGKTTLLNVLSQRINFGVITGDMLVNGKPLDGSFQRSTGYVQQQDLHLAEASVRESLQFAARLRQPASTPDSEKMDYVEKIIQMLGMTDYAEAIVGSIGRGLNVEQRKKLSIGVELVAKPSLLLFLDEPTSGLDSQSSWSIVQFLRDLADAGQSILCTIHQPSATLFEQFDRLLLLKKGGRTVYFGDIGENSHTLVQYFERNGARKCHQAENPAEYILECIGAGATASVSEDWGDIWANSPECHNTTSEIGTLQRELAAQVPVGGVSTDKHLTQKFATTYWTQLKYVTLRTMVQYWRSPTYLLAKFMLMVISGLFIGFTFWDIGNPFSIQGMQNAMFAIFLIQVLSAPLTNQILSQAEQTRELFEVRESSSNTFHWSCLLLAQYIAEMPYHIVFSSLLYCCFYFPVKYSTEASVAGYFYFVYCILFQFYYVSFALWVSYFSPDAASAAAIASLLFSFLIAFCGVLQPSDLAPHFWIFVFRLSPFTYFIQSYLGVTMHGREVVCKPDELDQFQPPAGLTCQEFAGPFVEAVGGYLQDPNATSNCEYCRYAVADEYLATIGVSYSQRWRNVGFICAYIIFNVCAMLVFYYLFRVKQWQTPKIFSIFKKKPVAVEPVRDIYEKKEGDEEVVFGKVERKEEDKL